MKNALIVIDIQNDYFPGGAFTLENADEACKVAVEAIEQAKRDGWLVVGVQHVNSPDAPFFKPDTEGVKTHSAIAAALGDAPTVVKSEADSFFKTNLEQIVREADITDIYLAGYRDGCRRSGHRQDHPPASNPWRIHWHGGGSGAWQLHGCAACAQVSPQPSYPDKARTGDGSGLVLCVPKQSPQNTVQLYSIHVSHFQAQALQPTPPRTHAALPNGSRALRDLARVGQRGSVRRPGRPPHPQALRAQSVCQVS